MTIECFNQIRYEHSYQPKTLENTTFSRVFPLPKWTWTFWGNGREDIPRTDIGQTKKLRTYILTPYFCWGHTFFSSFMGEDIHFSIILLSEDIHFMQKWHLFIKIRKLNPFGFSFLFFAHLGSLSDEQHPGQGNGDCKSRSDLRIK